ncbi:Osmolarity sensor protein EnvZ [Vibrio aerogenes CECT 7868]|uniref:histidine kinase n=1 Tax=Vibrio aerogenes CECT 7868 TaxID=1216006 RepID=A0A1M5UL96_9VIBR|nr:ATP-binding protein [Vibrio aerogenes]SHH63463.1 Osmolarity sensor protein EnvZ [Vibrio aerogenes CECT 7868]
MKAKAQSLLSRTFILTLLAILLAQGIASLIWYSQSRQKDTQGAQATAESMAATIASSVYFFQSLPVDYRHIILDQIRNMGGTRFFVSFNRTHLTIEPIRPDRRTTVIVDAVRRVLQTQLPALPKTEVAFSSPERLRVFKNDIFLNELPRSWAHETLTLPAVKPPILVVQIQLAPDEWLYIAGLMPAPYVTLDNPLISEEQVLFLIVSTLILSLTLYLLLRRQVRPLKRLSEAANEMSLDIHQPPLAEEGATELVTATRAFNRMQQRIRLYIHDRERLFSAISHDLKTPITRLRLRAELLDDPKTQGHFHRNLDELEMMVNGALQAVKETDIHENITLIDIRLLLSDIAESYNQQTDVVTISPEEHPHIAGRPLAIKRVLTNLIGNGVKYGGTVDVRTRLSEQWLTIIISDQGPGIPEKQLDAVFEPYVRLDHTKPGHGLGLGICRNVLHAHGGDLILYNLSPRGLCAEVYIPRWTDENVTGVLH